MPAWCCCLLCRCWLSPSAEFFSVKLSEGLPISSGLASLWLRLRASIQWLHTYPHVSHQQLYVFYFMIKMAGAVGLFSITFLLALPTDALRGMQAKRAFWSAINIICGLAILIGAALMRTAH